MRSRPSKGAKLNPPQQQQTPQQREQSNTGHKLTSRDQQQQRISHTPTPPVRTCNKPGSTVSTRQSPAPQGVGAVGLPQHARHATKLCAGRYCRQTWGQLPPPLPTRPGPTGLSLCPTATLFNAYYTRQK